MEFYEWLHDVTTLGYDENIMIPTEKSDIIKNLYELNYTPKEAISAYKDLTTPLPEAQPLEGVKTAGQNVKEVEKKLPKTNSVYNYDKWPEIFGLSESTIFDIMEAAQQYNEAQQGEKDSKSYSDWVKMYGGIHRESPSEIKTRSFLACIRWLISIGAICEKSLHTAQFATDTGVRQNDTNVTLLTDCQELLMNLIALNHVPDEVCPDMNDMISRIDDALTAPSTHSSSEMVDIKEGARRKAYQIFLNIWGEAANGSNYDIHQWAEFHNLLNKIIDNKPFKKVL